MMPFAAAALAIFVLLLLVEEPVFESEMVVEVDWSRGPFGKATSFSHQDAAMEAQRNLILSRELCLQVAEAIGSDQIFASANGPHGRELAAERLRANLKVTWAAAPSRFMTISYSNRDRRLVEPVLRKVLDSYLNKNSELSNRPGDTTGPGLTVVGLPTAPVLRMTRAQQIMTWLEKIKKKPN